jgi:ATP-dependent 26S proteasome regulatory subunit
VIVVATANDPGPLGMALLKRPGRFDRVALFPAPSAELRQRDLERLSAGKISGGMAAASAAMEHFSFVQVREAYICAGQLAFDRGEDVTVNDLVRAARQIRREARRVGVNTNGSVGFSLAELEDTDAAAYGVHAQA